MRQYTAASLFSGIGGLDLAFSWAGFDIRVQVEIDDYCRQVLKKHAPTYWNNAIQMEDIKHVTGADVGHVDVMFGGFPCQDISTAGQRAGITEQTRSGLWFEFLRLISDVGPHVVVLENVAAIHFPTTNDGGYKQPAPALIVAATLSDVGYDAIWLPIRASDIGAPQQRERWFCIAMGNTTRSRLEGRNWQKQARGSASRPSGRCWGVTRRGTEPRLARTIDGVPDRMDRHHGQFPSRPDEPQYSYEPPRVTGRRDLRRDRIQALGNAVVPQQALPIALAVKRYLDSI